MKGTIQLLAQRGGWGVLSEKEEPIPVAQAGSSLSFHQGEIRWGWSGLLSAGILSRFEIPAERDVAYAEFDLETMLAKAPPPLRVQPLPRFPSVSRDLALVVEETLPYRKIQEAVLQAGRPLLQEAVLFDIYHGKQVPAGKKSLALRLDFSDSHRTLTEEEVSASVDRILRALQEQFQAVLRSS